MTKLIDKINNPVDLKKLNVDVLPELADEIREILIKRITETGGHMGSNLGMVETTIAMHYVFNSPKDKFVFDVSHQSYTHKILTGRKAGFVDPEHYYDYSGYTTPSESEHDFFKVGHTATSVSLAVGLATGRNLTGGNENIIAVIGDGSMSGGEAFEGLNNAAMLDSNIIIIFNDNEMSIAPNYGGMYENFRLLRDTKGKAQNNFFTAMGMNYHYIEEGNDVRSLVEVFNNIKDTDKPTLIHIHTQKGKGCDWATENKEAGHWAMPAGFDFSKMGESYNSITVGYLRNKIEEDARVIAISPATPGAHGMMPDFREAAGKQFIDVGIAEEHAIALASGIAKNGGKPVVIAFSSFLQRTYDQLNQDLAMNNNAATILVFGGGITGGDCTHSGKFDIAMISNIPNLVCLAPTTKEEYLAMLDWSIDQDKHPVVIRVPGKMILDGQEIQFDEAACKKSKIVNRGSEVAIMALGNYFELGQEVLSLLLEKGISATLVNPVNYSQIDTTTLDALKEDHSIFVTLENGILDGGYGQKVASYLGDENVRTLNFGGTKEFNDLMPLNDILLRSHLTKEQIVSDILELI